MIFDGRNLFWFSFAGKFLREPFCRVAPRPCTPGVLSFHEESNQRRAKGTSPRELCCAKLSPPVCSDSGQMLGHLPTTSGSSYLHRCQSAPAAGGCPILAHHFGQQAVMSLHSITKGKAFGALLCTGTLNVCPHRNSFAAPVDFIFYIVFVVGVSHSAECDQGRCPLETHELFVKSSIKNFIMFCVSDLRFRSPERVSAGRFPRPESALHCTDPANWFCR